MNEYISFHKILDLIKQYQQSSARLHDFGYGDIVYFMNDSGTTTNYPFLFVTPQLISYDENITTYSLQLIFADIVNTDLSNEADVVSDMSLEARRFLSEIRRGFLFDDFDCSLPASATPFFERFNDHVGGVVLDVDITIFEDINACDFYPSPTATGTATPTPTPTFTPTPSVSCKNYRITNTNGFSTDYDYIDCGGNPQSGQVLGYLSADICAQLGTVVITNGATGTITDLGTSC